MKKNRRREAGPSDGRRAANPRETAFLILKETAAGRFPEESLADHGPLLSPRDLALTTALVYEVLRRQAFLDWLLQARLSAGRAGPDLTLVLRLGLAQILYFDRLGDHAIVAETVTLAQKIVPGRQGLVNAVLRGLLRERETGGPWPPEPPATLGIGESLALRHNCRLWLATDLLKRFGQAEAEKILAAYNRPTPPL
ncbi:MAG: hypothetical protein LBV21_02575 [Candidatus Adiutrix sp.]|jgi:16S rRNA (cytosine967-C5)-methyltransferase|nr:hypothetical protein [Candidatus Adiutrix sp.]